MPNIMTNGDEPPKRFSSKWWDLDAFNVNISIKRGTLFVISILLIVIIGLSIGLAEEKSNNFENKNYDPYGGGIRFLQSRDDTGSPNTSLEERQFNSKVSQLTSTPEAPNFSEYYGIDASIKNGSVMIERENFENKPLSVNDLEMANKGLL